jgi:large subunit ribosomal protein L14e
MLGGSFLPAIEVGRICVKTSGREVGMRCVIVEIIDKNFVLITGPKNITGVKRRRANVNHIRPTEDTIKIRRGASDEDIAKALSKTGEVEAKAEE